MGIRAQEVTRDRIYIEMGDARSFEVTRQQIVAHALAETGTRAQRRQKTIAWLKQSAIAALGAEQFNPRAWFIDYSDDDGGFNGFGTAEDPNTTIAVGV